MDHNGFFITFEGGEGCGKSTQIKRLEEAIRKWYPERELVVSRSPGGPPASERIRGILKEPTPGDDLVAKTELLLFAASHAQMCEKFIRPALERGAVVLIDRFTDSTEVYQGFARGLDPADIRSVDAFACGDIVPDLTILLDIDPVAGVARTRNRAGQDASDRFDTESMTFHQAVRSGFLALAEKHKARFAVIDAAPDAETVHNAILEVVRERLEHL